jgi:hypothetical protein
MPPSQRFMELVEQMKDIHSRKNAGYSGDSPDAFENFRRAELFGVSAFKGCMVRLSDKFVRSANLIKNPNNEQVGEALTDTLLDLANYAIIAICLYEEEQQKESKREIETDVIVNTSMALDDYIIKEIEFYKKQHNI